MKISLLFKKKFPQQSNMEDYLSSKISVLGTNSIVVISGVNHFLGINLARSLLQQKISVIGIPYVLNDQLPIPLDIASSKLFILLQLSQLYRFSQYLNSFHVKKINYIYLTDFYAASFLSASLSQKQITQVFRHQLNLIPHHQQNNQKITFIIPYLNPQLKHALNPVNKLNIPLLFQKLNTLDNKSKLNFRTVSLADCYGPDYDLTSDLPLSQLFSGIKSGLTQININGDAQQKINPLYINDALEGIFKATFILNSSQQHYLLVNSKSLTLFDFTYLLKLTLSLKNNFVFKQSKINAENLVDYSTVKSNYKNLNWHPKISLFEGIQLFESWLQPSITDNASLLDRSWVSSPYQFSHTLQRIAINSSELQALTTKTNSNKLISLGQFLKKICKQVINTLLNILIPDKLRLIFRELKYQLPPLPNLSYVWKPVLISILIISLITPLILFGYRVVQSSLTLRQSVHNLSNNQFIDSANQAKYARQQFKRLSQIVGYASFLDQVPLINNAAIKAQRQFELAELGSETINSTAISINLFQETLKTILDPTIKTDPRIPLSQMHLYLIKNQILLSELQALLPDQLPYFSQKLIGQTNYQQFKQQLPIARSYLQTLITALSQYPDLTGYVKPQHYLIIFQNNRELRPTGGFIGSLGLVTFNQGKLDQWQIYDVYDADGQLLGYVEPPDPIRDHLGEVSWYLRDANWDPDFPTTAQKLKWFINKELKYQVSGVIALDVDFIQQLVAGLGGVYLPDQQVNITADNFYQYMQEKSELDFFPGSHQKGDYLSLIADAILYKFKHQSNFDWQTLANYLQQGLQSKHALLYFDHQPTQDLIAQLGWSGDFNLNSISTNNISNLLSQAKHYAQNGQVLSAQSDTIGDQVAIVEANLGVNKVNQYLDRQIHHQVNIFTNQSISQQLQIYYQNQSTSESWLGGDYKNYLRLYLPIGTQINNILVGPINTSDLDLSNSEDQNISFGLTAIDMDFISQTKEHGFEVFGFLVNIPQQSQYLVQVDYSLPKIKLPNQFTYHLNLIKQPGTSNDPYWLTINYPDNYQPTNSSSDYNQLPNDHRNPVLSEIEGLTSDHTLRYNMQLSKDQTINISFIKNKIKSL